MVAIAKGMGWRLIEHDFTCSLLDKQSLVIFWFLHVVASFLSFAGVEQLKLFGQIQANSLVMLHDSSLRQALHFIPLEHA